MQGSSADTDTTDRSAASAASAGSWRERLLAVGVVAVVVSPIVVGAVSFVGDTWYPAGDWAHFVFRVAQVGTRETPLVGSYTTKGWAHPGPLGWWLAAPLYRLTGSDPRALEWTAAIVNVGVLAWLGHVAWRMGRWPLFLATMALAAVLVHGITAENLVDLWNPYLPLTSFLLTIFLVWDAALGRRRALLEAVFPAVLAMQNHLAFVSLTALLVVWLVAWARWWPRLLPDTVDERHTLPRPPWRTWFGPIRRGVLVAVVLCLPPLADAVFDLHNPLNIARSFRAGGADRVGLLEGFGLVGRYVRADGPWMGGPESKGHDLLSVQGSGVLPLLVIVAMLAGCIQVARRRQLVPVAALATLSLFLVLGAIPAVAQVPLPNEDYLMQWLKVIGGVAWFAVAWTIWRVVEPWVRAAPARRAAAAALATGVVVAGAATSWGDATTVELPLEQAGEEIDELMADLDGRLPRDQTIRVERRGEFWHVYGAGVFYRLAEDGYDVVTNEGGIGLKWGHGHRWNTGEPYDLLITVAVDGANDQCALDPRAEEIASWDGLTPEERAWLVEVQLRRLGGADKVTDEERARAEKIGPRDQRLGIFLGPQACAKDRKYQIERAADSSIMPLLVGAGAIVVATAVGGWWVIRRRSGA